MIFVKPKELPFLGMFGVIVRRAARRAERNGWKTVAVRYQVCSQTYYVAWSPYVLNFSVGRWSEEIFTLKEGS